MLCGVRIFARGKESDMYIYEMHCHTQETSKCSRISGAELIDFYHKLGYTGVVITDHFFNGNTTVPADLPWAERVERFAEGYRAAKRRGDEIGVDVFFGWEFAEKGSHFLTYGLDIDWLAAHSDCDKMTLAAYCDLVRADGGVVAQAHPYRSPGRGDMIRLLPHKVDGVETVNASRTPFENRMARVYAAAYGLPCFCGSDTHSAAIPRLAAMVTERPAVSLRALAAAVLAGEAEMQFLARGEDGIWCKVDKFAEN